MTVNVRFVEPDPRADARIWVRRAYHDDVPWLLDELREFSEFFGSKHPLFPDDREHAKKVVHDLIREHVFFVAERGWVRAGFIAGLMHRHFFNPKWWVLTEVLWWVSPEFRGSRAGLLLLDEFVEYGRDHAHMIVMALEAKSPIHPKTLERRGFHLHESSYLLEV